MRKLLTIGKPRYKGPSRGFINIDTTRYDYMIGLDARTFKGNGPILMIDILYPKDWISLGFHLPLMGIETELSIYIGPLRIRLMLDTIPF